MSGAAASMLRKFTFLRRILGSRPVELSAKPVATPAASTIPAYQGPFEPLLTGDAYLTLLMLPPTASPALQFISNVVRENPEYRQSVLLLLSDNNWRFDLVAAIAVLLSSDRAALSPALWDAIDQGSWVAPQLAVALSTCDPQFVPLAKGRILAGCPVVRAGRRSALAQHVIAGPGTPPQRSAKTLAAMLYLVQTIPSETEWANSTRLDPDVEQLLRADIDSGDKLAAHWAGALRERLAELGLAL